MRKFLMWCREHAPILLASFAVVASCVSLWAALSRRTLDVDGFLGTIPQWITAAVAIGALVAATISIRSQREIARKRAASDFFIKTEMDSDLLDAHKAFVEGVEALETHVAAKKSLEDFCETKACSDVENYLNLHELMAVSVHQDVFDDNVCFDFWHRELLRAYELTKQLIEHIQALPGNKRRYVDLQKLSARWEKKAAAFQ